MSQSVNCRKVMSLLALYIDGKLDLETKEFVEKHLQICPECGKKHKMLKELICELRNAYMQLSDDSNIQEKKVQFNIKEYEKFQTNISAYFDNELQLNESLSMKKYMIKFPNARKELEDLYFLHNLMSASFNNTKKYFNDDFSRKICYKVQGKTFDEKNNFRLKVATYVASVLLMLSLLLYSTPVGKTVIDRGVKFFKKNVYVLNPVSDNIIRDIN